jgi:hypothetical protein
MNNYKISIFTMFVTIALFSTGVWADIKIIKGTLERGVSECRRGNYSKGIDAIIDGAMDLRREAPKHVLNTQWRSKLRFCINKWTKEDLSNCRKKHTISSYENLLKAEKKSSIIASTATKKTIRGKIKSCFYSLKNHYKKTCKKTKDVVVKINKLKKLVVSNKKFTKSINGVLTKCVSTQWKSALKECSTSSSVATLKRVFILKKILPASKKTEVEYKKCIIEQMTGGRDLCRSMKYGEGKKLLSKSHYLLRKLKIKDLKSIKTGEKWKKECGFYRISFDVIMKAVSGGIPFHLPAKAELIVAASKDGKSITACGEMKFKSPALKYGKCSTLATASYSNSNKKGFLICLKGTLTKKKTDKNAVLNLKLDAGFVRNKIKESVQHICKGKQPIVFNAKLFENLFQKNRLKVKINAHGAEKKMFRIPVDLVGGRKAVFLGSWTLHLY